MAFKTGLTVLRINIVPMIHGQFYLYILPVLHMVVNVLEKFVLACNGLSYSSGNKLIVAYHLLMLSIQ